MWERNCCPQHISFVFGIKFFFSSCPYFKGSLPRKRNRSRTAWGAACPPLRLCAMQKAGEEKKHSSKPEWLFGWLVTICSQMVARGGSAENVLPYHMRHCGLKGVTCLRREGVLIIYHTDRQSRVSRLGHFWASGKKPNFFVREKSCSIIFICR